MALSNVEYDAVMRHYDDLRERKRRELEQRREAIYREIPQIASLDDEIAVSSLEAARARIRDPLTDLDGSHRQLGRISARKKQLLLAHGYPQDALELQYECPACRDTGLIDGRHCSCFERTAAALFHGSSALGELLEKENFSRFSYEWYSDIMTDESTGLSARETAREAVDKARALFDGESIRGNLYLYGNTGVGKTFLTHCIAKEALDRGLSVLYYSSGDLFDALARSAFDKDGPKRTSLKDLAGHTDLLIIDDLGTELTNAFTASELFRLLNERIRSRRSTVISMNLSLRELSGKYSERVLSRITSEFTILKLIGDDIRILKTLSGGSI